MIAFFPSGAVDTRGAPADDSICSVNSRERYTGGLYNLCRGNHILAIVAHNSNIFGLHLQLETGPGNPPAVLVSIA